jgi:hypothetical protein
MSVMKHKIHVIKLISPVQLPWLLDEGILRLNGMGLKNNEDK